MPTNLYGPNDNFDLEKSYVLPALHRKIYLGKCLEENNRDTIRSDLNKRPIEGTNGDAEEKNIVTVLARYGVFAKRATTMQPYPEASNTSVSVEVWGSGKPMREFLWSGEMADTCIFIMENTDFKDITSLHVMKGNKKVLNKEINNTHN